MKSELLRKALMSKMVNGGNVGDGGKKDDKKKQQAAAKSALTGTASGAPIDDVNKAVSFFTEKQMSPQEWATYAEKQGWKPFHAESEIPVDQQIKMNKYIQYYDPRQYARTETGFVKLGDVGKGVDYSRDTTYKPNIQYGLTKPTNSVPPTQTATQDSLKFQFLPRIKLYGSQKEQYDLFKSDPETYKKRIEEYSRLKSEWEKKNEGMTGGLSGAPIYIKGYTEPKTSTTDPLQPKKKGGIVANYKNGGTASAGARATYNAGKSAGNVGGKASGVGGGFDVSKLNPELFSQTGELAGTGLDMLDRRDERSSIAGQTGVGALKGAGKGAALGSMIMPGIGTAVGAIGGAVIGGAIGASRGKKEKKERLADISEQSTQSAIAAQEYDPLNPNQQPQGVKVNKNDTKGGLAGLFANGGQVKQISNSANKINYAKGGTIKGAGTGTSDSIVTDINKKGIPEGSFITPAKNNEMAKGIRGMVLGQNPNKVAEFKKGGTPKSDKVAVSNGEHLFTPTEKEKITRYLGKEILEKLAPEAEENEMEKKKGGEMIKRADGSYSKRGLWDNIRANKGSGKKPTPEMLKQEKKIIEEKAKGGYVVKRSSERKGKTHVVIGPDGTKKYFGDSKLGQHPNDPARKKAFYARHEKNLKKNPYFRAFARETWAEGGTVGSKMNKEMLEKELIKKANGGNVAVADKTKVKSPNVSSEALKKLKDKQKQIDERGKKYDEEIAKGNTIVVIPNKPTIESKKFKSADSTYFYPNAYVSPTEGYKYTKAEVGGKYKGNVKENPKDVYMSNPNAVIRQDSSEYARLGYKNGGNVAVADKTKVKSPNVYEGKMPEKKELVSTLQESRVLERKDGTSKVEVKMPDGTWKTTYDLQAKAKGGTLTKAKAKEILHDKSVQGKPLTDKQRKYMGWVAGGKKSMGGIVGKYAMGGNVNRDWDWG